MSCSFCEKYNGYTNRPTWLYQLWASNDQGAYNWLLSQARDAVDQADNNNDAVSMLAATLQNEFDRGYYDKAASLETDLWSTISAFINWQEIAEYAIESAMEEN